MKLLRSATFILFVSIIVVPKGNACVRPLPYIAAGAVATVGAVMIGMGGLLTKYAQDDEVVIASHYGSTQLTVTNYTVDAIACYTSNGKVHYSHAYTATCEDVYVVPTGNTTEEYAANYGSTCGDTPEQALVNAQNAFPVGHFWNIYYPFADHSGWTFKIPSSSYRMGAYLLFAIGAPVLVVGGLSALLIFKLR